MVASADPGIFLLGCMLSRVKLPLNQILCGDAVRVLGTFPEERVDLAVFSPPYWGLRDYGVKTETVWGGSENCEHEWREEKMTLVHENRNFAKGSQEEVHGARGTTFIKKYDDKRANFCVRCGAWRGQLGLEPHPQLYVDHMVEVFRAIGRVIKKTGSVYVVLGDTYAGSHCGRGDKTLFQNYRRIKVAGNLYSKPSPQSKTEKSGWLQPKQLLEIPSLVSQDLKMGGWILRDKIIWNKPNAMPGSQRDRLTRSYEEIFQFVKNTARPLLWRNELTAGWVSTKPK